MCRWQCQLSNTSKLSNSYRVKYFSIQNSQQLPSSKFEGSLLKVCLQITNDYIFDQFQGCYRLVINFILENETKIGVAVLCAALVHIVGVVLTCLLARSISKANYEEIRWGCRGQDEKPKSGSKAHSGQIRENSSFEEQKQPLTSGSSAFNQANNQQTGNVATSSTSGQTATEAANAPPPPFLPPSHVQSSQQNNFQQAAVCFRVSRVIEFLLWGSQN